jgi:colanic acid biosynthesis glycosyl transferase WcaI
MKKRILLIGYNFAPEPTGIGKYSGEMMRWLAAQGHNCVALTAYPYYPHWQVQEPYTRHRRGFLSETESFASGGLLTTYRCPMYIPAKPSGLKRMVLDSTFLLSSGLKLLQLLAGAKFDAVLVVAPSFQLGLLGVLVRKLRGTTFLYHIQDMQIEAARDLQMIKSPAIINALLKIERYIFSRASIISTISEAMVQRISEKAGRPVILLPNWTNISAFYPIDNQSAAKAAFGFAPTDKVVLYSGAIGEKQGLEAIIEAANTFREQPQVKFVICGSGPYKEKLEAMAHNRQLANVLFFPLQPYDMFNQFLNCADVHLVIQKANASDLVMPSKLTTILAVGGLALITANENSGLHRLVSKHQMGLLVQAENQQALNEGIQAAIAEPHASLKANARAYAEEYITIERIMHKLEEAIGAQ